MSSALDQIDYYRFNLIFFILVKLVVSFQ